jgi:copper resistance protein B
MSLFKITILMLSIAFPQLILANESLNDEHSQNDRSEQQMEMDPKEHREIKKTKNTMPMKMDMEEKTTGTRDPHANSGGYEYRHMGGWEDTDEMTVSKIIFEQLEYRDSSDSSMNRWDMQGWRGTDYEKFWLKFEGEDNNSESSGEFELQTLYSEATSAYWDLQFGARYDRTYGDGANDERYFGVFGVQGLAPYWFEIESALFIDKDANVSARFVASYDLLFSQRLIFQPRFELNASANDLPDFGIGQGINDIQIDLRLRYEFKREIAPYIGISWQKKYGDSAAYSQLEGGLSENTEIVLGVRIWF